MINNNDELISFGNFDQSNSLNDLKHTKNNN